MIGQKRLLEKIDKQVDSGVFPHFVIVEGSRGSGKYLVSSYIAGKLGAELVEVEKSVEAVRNLISTVNKSSIKTVYVFRRSEELSAQAVNAMLKTLEEPSEYAYFVFTTRNSQMLLETIRSRGDLYTMSRYSKAELTEYNEGKPVPEFCQTPYDVDLYNRNSGLEEFVDLVIDNITEVTLVNAMRIAERVDVDGSDSTKFDLNIFFEAFKKSCRARMTKSQVLQEAQLYLDWIAVTSRYQKDALRVGANLKMLFDMWLIDLRGGV